MSAAAQHEQLLATPQGRRALSSASPTFFDSLYCGMWAAPHRTKWLDTCNAAILNARATRSKSMIRLLAPRDHGKTETLITLSLREVCLNRNIRILWISESLGTAQKRLKRLTSLLTSPEIRRDWETAPEQGFGPFRKKDNKGQTPTWTSKQIYLSRTLHSTDPTVEAVGTGGGITGGHFDLIVCDDLEDDRTTYSAAQRAKTRGWWRGTVLPMLSRGGTILVVGTRKHHDDLYTHMKAPAWIEIEDPAILEWPDEHRVKAKWDPDLQQEVIQGVEVVGPSKVLWEAERPIEYLLRERYLMTSTIFEREFQHKVVDDSTAPFRMEWLEGAKHRGANMFLGDVPPLRNLTIVTGWDLALVEDRASAEARDTDYTCGVTVALDRDTGDRYLLGIYRNRGMTPAAIRGAVLSQFERFGGTGKVQAVGVERNAFGNIHFMGLQRSTDLPLKPHMTTGRVKASAWDGVTSMGAHLENGKWIFPYHEDDQKGRGLIDVLVAEAHGYGKEAHDDLLLAWWIAELMLREPHFDYGVGEEPLEPQEELVEHRVESAADIQGRLLWAELASDLGLDDADDDDDDDEDEDDDYDEDSEHWWV